MNEGPVYILMCSGQIKQILNIFLLDFLKLTFEITHHIDQIQQGTGIFCLLSKFYQDPVIKLWHVPA